MTVTVGVASSSIAILLLTGDNANATYVGTGQYLYVWGAQVEEGPSPTTYIPTTTATVTVGTVLNGVGIRQAAPTHRHRCTSGDPTVSTPTMCLQSQTLKHSSWTLFNATVTANNIATPDATLTADKITDTANFAPTLHLPGPQREPSRWRLAPSRCRSTARMGTLKWFVISGGRWCVTTHRAAFDLERVSSAVKDCLVSSHAITSVGDGWYRCTFTFSTPIKPEYICISYVSNADNLTRRTLALATVIFTSWGVQLEPCERCDGIHPDHDCAGHDLSGNGCRRCYGSGWRNR